MSKNKNIRPETKVEQAEKPAETISQNQERPETRVVEAEKPAETLSEGQERPETVVQEAEKPQVVAAKGEERVPPSLGKKLHLGNGIEIPVIAVNNVHFGISGEPRVTVTVSLTNEDGTTEGLQLHDIPERLIK